MHIADDYASIRTRLNRLEAEKLKRMAELELIRTTGGVVTLPTVISIAEVDELEAIEVNYREGGT